MSILRNRFFQKFCMVPNDAVTDTRLSIPARIVYVYLLSRPDGWMVRNQEVMDSVGIKNMRAMAKCWSELISFGWIRREKAPPNTDGAGTYSYEILEASSKNDGVIKTPSQNSETSVQNVLFAINGRKTWKMTMRIFRRFFLRLRNPYIRSKISGETTEERSTAGNVNRFTGRFLKKTELS